MLERILIIVLLNLVVYFRTLRFGLVSDDINQRIEGKFKNWTQIPLLIMTGFFHKNLEVSHFFNILFHTTVGVLIYLAFGHTTMSFMAAMMFCINPVTTQVSTWLSGKWYAMTTIFILLMFLYQPAAPVFYFLANAHAVSGALAALFFVKQINPLWILFGALTFFFTYRRIFKHEANTETGKGTTWGCRLKLMTEPMRKVNFDRFVIFAKTIAYYLQLCMFPRRLGMYHTFLFTYGLTPDDTKYWVRKDKWFWCGLVVLIAMITAIIVLRGSMVSFGLVWFLLFILPHSNIIMWNQAIAERYCYLPTIGLMLIVASLATIYPAVFYLFFGYYLARLLMHIDYYRSEFIANEANLYQCNHPDQYYVWGLTGTRYQDNGELFTALDCYRRGFQLRRHDLPINFKIAMLCAQIGLLKEALDHVKMIEDNKYYDVDNGLTTAIPMMKQEILDRLRERYGKAEFQKRGFDRETCPATAKG